MLNVNNYGARTTLAVAMTSNALTLRVPSGMGAAFDPGPGNRVWVTIRSGSSFERVKVIGRSGDVLTLEGRGGDNSAARQWPAGACLEIEWNPAQLCEFTQNCMTGAPAPTGVEPQTVCMASCACIDIGADGRITRISGGSSC